MGQNTFQNSPIEFDLTEIRKEIELAKQIPVAAQAEFAKTVDKAVGNVVELDPESEAGRQALTDFIENFGTAGLKASASKTQFMSLTIDKLAEAEQGGGPVSRSLVDLRREISNLDPANVDFSGQGILNLFLRPIKRYFDKYKKSEVVIQEIIESLKKSKKSLQNDNITLNLDKEDLKKISSILDADIKIGTEIDEKIMRYLRQTQASDCPLCSEKVRFIEDEVLLPLGQRVMDLRQLLVVNQQGRLSMEVILRNNQELCRAVDRAINVTVSALQTAVMVAGALYNQRIALKKIQAVNETTDNLIAGTARMLKTQGAEIGRRSMESAVSVDTLKRAFEDAMAAMEDIGRYRQEALPKIRETIERFRELSETGERALSALEGGQAGTAP